MDIKIITEVLIPILSAILVYIIVPFVKTKTTLEKRKDAYFFVKLAVQGAEQIFDYKHAGESKMDYVKQIVENAGLHITDEDLIIMIESAVLEMNKAKDLMLDD